MNPTMTPIISPQELISLKQTDPIVLIDSRASGPAKEQYLARHLEGALYADLERQLADKKTDPANGGRHPLPTPARFSLVLKDLGIAPESNVIVYDDKNGSNAAARFWWMLKAAGHKKVQVLDGGIDAAIAAGFPVGAGEETALATGPYPVNDWQLPLADMNEVANAAASDGSIVIDVRDVVRFRGEKEPIDLIAGHIPGAINIPFTGNLGENGAFLAANELREKYEQALNGVDTSNVIVHCGSGVTACHTILAMAQAGLEIPKLYVGSWSEWSRNDREIGKGD